MPIFPLPRFRGRSPVISSGFGVRKGTPVHKGADLAYRAEDGDPPYKGKYTAERSRAFYSPAGQPVLAFDDGEVVQSADKRGIGGDVWVHHLGSRLVTRYAHLSKRLVKVGDKVTAGQQLGVWGAGHGTPFVHLHFEVLEAGRRNSQTDPKPFLDSAEILDGPTRAPIRGPVARVDVTRPALATAGFGGWSWLLLLALLVGSKKS